MKPSAAQKAGKKAEKLHDEVYGETKVEEPNLEVIDGKAPSSDGASEDKTEDAPPAEPVTPTNEGKPVDWEHKYKTLQGMYNADTARLNALAKNLEERNHSLETTLSAMQSVQHPSFNSEGEAYITDEDIDDYGYDMIDVVRRAAREEVASLQHQLKELQNQNLQLSQSVGKVNADSVANLRQNVFDTLGKEVPDWQQLNIAPDFLEWLAELDTFSGQPRQQLLERAFENNDAPRVVAFFKKYVAEQNLVTGRGNQTDTPSPTVTLDSLVAPGRPQQGGNTTPTEDSTANEIWSQVEIQQFYKDVQQGKFKNNPKEKDAIERRIHKAANEGRIR